MLRKDRIQQWKSNLIVICLFVLPAVCILSSCKPKDQLVDYRVPKTPEERKVIQTAPLVLVGTVESDSAAGPDIVSHWDKTLPLQLHKIRVSVEGWLRGDLSSSQVDLYYYKINGPYSGGLPLGDWKNRKDLGAYPNGRHRIFFARRDGNLLRLVCDYRDTCTIRIGSGTHPDTNALIAGNVPLEAKIANILFTRGGGVSDRDFANSLGYDIFKVDKEYAVPKLKQLIQESGSPEIRKEACHWLGVLRDNYTENDRRIETICQQNKTKEPDSR